MADGDATVLILDDEASVRRGVARLVRAAGLVARTFASPAEFLRQPLPQGPACLVLDYSMDELNGLEVQEALRHNRRRIPIVFVSGHGTIPAATTALKRGADDFLEKPFRPQALMAAIQAALQRDRRQLVEREDRERATDCYVGLTAREREVMALVVLGKLNKQVADDLKISEKTVKVHRGRVMHKMRVDSLAELVRLSGQIDHQSVEAPAVPVPPAG